MNHIWQLDRLVSMSRSDPPAYKHSEKQETTRTYKYSEENETTRTCNCTRAHKNIHICASLSHAHARADKRSTIQLETETQQKPSMEDANWRNCDYVGDTDVLMRRWRKVGRPGQG
jgi:hypothetical protein